MPRLSPSSSRTSTRPRGFGLALRAGACDALLDDQVLVVVGVEEVAQRPRDLRERDRRAAGLVVVEDLAAALGDLAQILGGCTLAVGGDVQRGERVAEQLG